MDLAEIRKTVIAALFSDGTLTDLLVLKGGNAISVIYGFGSRSSIDVDLSIETDFEDPEEIRRRIADSLRRGFGRGGYVMFDDAFEIRPAARPTGTDDTWGGYEFRFKVISEASSQLLLSNPDKARRLAEVVSPGQAKTFKIQISKFEFCRSKTKAELGASTVYVYTPSMIVLEKIRALCQQMPEYALVRRKQPRARDFYDIHAIITEGTLELGTPDNLELTRHIFSAKQVPLHLISRLSDYREFHRLDWDAVRDSVTGYLDEFDFYFDFVIGQILALKSLWVE